VCVVPPGFQMIFPATGDYRHPMHETRVYWGPRPVPGYRLYRRFATARLSFRGSVSRVFHRYGTESLAPAGATENSPARSRGAAPALRDKCWVSRITILSLRRRPPRSVSGAQNRISLSFK
jgi:hypothetical protein